MKYSKEFKEEALRLKAKNSYIYFYDMIVLTKSEK